LDWGTTNSGIEDNYSHDNEGAGYLAVQLEGVPAQSNNNVFRRNRSENDGLKNDFAAMMVYGDVGTVTFEGNSVSGPWAVREDSMNNAGLRFTCNTFVGPFRAWWDGAIYEDLGSFGAATGQASCGQAAAAPPPTTGTRTPPDAFLTTSDGAIWWLDDWMVVRNGEHHRGGWGSHMVLAQGLIHVFGTDNQWWRDAGIGWTPIGSTEPK
jgi:hypothetical protein